MCHSIARYVSQMDMQSIMIDNADGLDYGDYTCVARNSLNTANLTRTLNVIVKAKVSCWTVL